VCGMVCCAMMRRREGCVGWCAMMDDEEREGVWGISSGFPWGFLVGIGLVGWMGWWVGGWLGGYGWVGGGGEGRLVDSMHGFWSWKYGVHLGGGEYSSPSTYSNSSNHLPLRNPQPKLSPHLTLSPTSTHSPPFASPPPAIPHHPSPAAPDSHPYSPGPSDSSAARCCLSSARQPPCPASDPGLRLLCGGAGRRGRPGGIRFRRRGRGGGGPRCRCL